jgi:hypothetical protein
VTGAPDRYRVWLVGCTGACHCELRFAGPREAPSGVVASLPLANPGDPADEVQRDWTHDGERLFGRDGQSAQPTRD